MAEVLTRSDVGFSVLKNQARFAEVAAFPVANEVVWVNPNLQTPLDLRLNHSSKAARFAYSMAGDAPVSIPRKKTVKVAQFMGFLKSEKQVVEWEKLPTLEYWPNHHRSGLLGRAYFADNNGVIYRDIDIKGSGAIFDHGGRPFVVKPGEKTNQNDRVGLMYLADALHDSHAAEVLSANGVRTHRSLAVIKINEIVYDGQVLSLEVAKARGIVEYEEFAIQVRAYGTKARLADLITNAESGNLDAALTMAKDAIKMVGFESGRKTPMTLLEYKNWMKNEAMENMRKMHSLGIYHKWLWMHNITLDCRFVDLDDAQRAQYYSDFEQDSASLRSALTRFNSALDQLIIAFEPQSINMSTPSSITFAENRDKNLLSYINNYYKKEKIAKEYKSIDNNIIAFLKSKKYINRY